MILKTSRMVRAVALFATVSVVASCGLPRTGPNKEQIFAGSVDRKGNAYIVVVNDQVTEATAVTPPLGFSDSFKNAGLLGSDTISPGDTLGLTIWENVDDGLLAGEAQNQTALQEVQVDGSGFIFVPYAGRIKASGNTPDGIRRIITAKLDEQTPDPQVEVRRLAGDGSSVSLIGSVGAQGVYPIEAPTRTLSTMLAAAGGVSIEPEVAQVTIIRGNQRSQVWFQDLFRDPKFDIALRGGDRILVEQDNRAYTALGATGGQARVTFETQRLSAIEAVAQVGGLSSNTADPTGVFVMRDETPEIARAVLDRDDLQGEQRVVYVLNLSEPNGIFFARDFSIRDGDTIYVTEAPFAQWSKAIGALTGTLGAVASVSTTGTTLNGL